MFVNSKSQQKPHRKSRLGCKICKARKIKCDEVRPTCGNCVRRFTNPSEECEFETPVLSSSSSRSIASPSSSSTSLGSQPSHSSNFTSRSMELRLFHHYSTVTCHTMPLCKEPCGLGMWTKSIPSIAFDCQPVYSAMLGIAAMHLFSLAPHDVSLRATIYQYFDETISSQREGITSITTANSPALFATSMLLGTHARYRAIYLAPTENYTLPLDWFNLHVGLRKVAVQTLPHIKDKNIKEYVALDPNVHATMRPDDFPRLKIPEDSFLRVWNQRSMPSKHREIYSETVKYLELIIQRMEAGESFHWIHRRLSILPGEVADGYVDLLEREEPLALAILARFFALYKFLDEPWRLKGTPELEIQGLAGMVREEWEWAMQWPLQILENADETEDELVGKEKSAHQRALTLL